MGQSITAMALDIDQTHLASVSVGGRLMVHSLQKGVSNTFNVPTDQAS
jgi:hypothetical protein